MVYLKLQGYFCWEVAVPNIDIILDVEFRLSGAD